MTRPLAGKSALITGSTQGIGLAIARRLATAGSNLVLNGLGDQSTIEGLRQELEREHGISARHYTADLRDPDQIEQMITSMSRSPVDILINNAVVRHSGPVDQFSREAWDESVAVNLSAAFHTIRLVLPAMKERGWGRIINVSSIYGLRGTANRVGYVTTKTGLIGLTRAVAIETAASGITCNAVCPGTTETPIHEAAVQSFIAAQRMSRAQAEREILRGKQPTGRFIAADGVAALVEFLCGPEAADITGAMIPIDGAWSSA